MNAINKESILSKTHYGLGIYSHILRLYFPDEIVMRLVGRDCGLCRNPFNANRETLHIFIEKENVLSNSFDKEFAKHTDSENAIPADDAFGFAELHYKQSGEELLQTLNKEMFLRIGEEKGFYTNSRKPSVCPQIPKSPCSPFSPLFSFFKAPISNTKPHKAVSLLQIYNAIKGDYYKEKTQKLRAMLSPLSCGEGSGERSQARKFKAANFDYCTFSGVFSVRNDKALIQHSNMLCVDFDHLSNVELLRNQLLQDDYFDTLLLFRSPSGDGLKWIVPIDVTQATHANYFLSVSNYLKATYNVEADKSGKDISRACFIPHDNDVFINPVYLQ